ncbi:maltokinase N-terminal cap-like domain-containing protein [Lapillicoccus jejuensis]|uniref:Maltokinase n=1 Tax=Lapillicoccus jejuensis TaxID=402171 RepID=A0A542E353_9MICO|nr:trehalose synthase-fused probable maltokinase [Lapillicoccus jejuensis]
MAEIHRTTLVPGKLDLLAEWLPRQRWCATKGREPRLRKLGGYRLDDPTGEVGIEVMVVADESGATPVVYQVPMTYRAAPLDDARHALIGEAEHGVLGHRWFYDAPHDPVFVDRLLALVEGEVPAQHQDVSHTLDERVVGTHVAGPHVRLVRSHVLRGEQSNTSVVCEVVEVTTGLPAEPVIVKLFRTLQEGENPDVVVQSALTEAGSTQVPATVGHVVGTWLDPLSPAQEGREVTGHLAFAQRFFPGVEDAWRVALRAAGEGTDFAREARELGESTARIHVTLAQTLGTHEADDAQRSALVASVRERAAAALAEVPALASYESGIAAVLDRFAHAPWPALQRVHGDYHLGQVLHVGDRGWVAVDFEGEPLRPLSERVRPDLALRDVAGMLRSLDYAGGSVELDRPGTSARGWVSAGRAAFLAGYAAVTGTDPSTDPTAADVLAGLELDKALYEVVYEARNRPSWLGIPTAAVQRLVTGDPAPRTDSRKDLA